MGKTGKTHLSQGTGEWTLTNISVDNEYLLEGLDNETYSYLIYTFTIKRSTTYYVLLIIVPSFILTILCVVGLFWRRVNADSYIDNVGPTTLLKFAFFSLA